MGAEVEHHTLLATTEDHGVCERRKTGADFDGATTSIIQHAIVESPAVDIPYPASDGAVDDCGPDESKDHGRKKTPAFGNRSHNDSSSYGTELHLGLSAKGKTASLWW